MYINIYIWFVLHTFYSNSTSTGTTIFTCWNIKDDFFGNQNYSIVTKHDRRFW